MRCSCCDRILSDEEATARFAPAPDEQTIRYTEMCNKCITFLPPSVKILTTKHHKEYDDDKVDHETFFDYEVDDDN